VEDRSSERIYLELGDASVASSEARRDELATMPHVHGVTRWENCVPGRTDLPSRVQDGRRLIVVEADVGFASPPAPAGTTEAHCFERTARPSQGILTGRPTLGLLIVWISPRAPELTQRLRDWGDFVHIRHIAAAGIPGFTQISVYENVAGGDPRYMHFYEFDTLEAEATLSTMIEHVAPRLGGVGSDAYADWADWRPPGGRLFYCNTFRRVEEPGT
jgi:hypothetical protein